VAIAVVVVVLLLPSRNDLTSTDGSQTTTETTTDTTTDATETPTDTTATVTADTRPESLAGGDTEADQELWDSVRGSGAVDGGCSYVTPTASTARSSLECAAVDPELDRPVRFDAHRSAAEAQTAVVDIASRLSGNRGSCEAGGTFLGEQSSRYMACGIVPPTDARAAGLYVISWSDPDLPYAITIVDDDPANAWAWFSAHDSL
jgi:hypothetical protein